MAESRALDTRGSAAAAMGRRVLLVRVGIVSVLFVLWQILAVSGLFYRDVMPTLQAVGIAIGRLVLDGSFYADLWTTAYEVAIATIVGAGLGLLTGIALGSSRFLGRAFEPYLYYLGPTPKIIFFPIMILWFGVGSGSKMAMGAFSCFFPVALSTAAAMRQINPVLVRVGESFRANALQMVSKVYLPAMREPVINGLRLGIGICLIGVLLAETKISNSGLGFLVIQNYRRFDMPAMYGLLFLIFAFAIGMNAAISQLGASRRSRSR